MVPMLGVVVTEVAHKNKPNCIDMPVPRGDFPHYSMVTTGNTPKAQLTTISPR